MNTCGRRRIPPPPHSPHKRDITLSITNGGLTMRKSRLLSTRTTQVPAKQKQHSCDCLNAPKRWVLIGLGPADTMPSWLHQQTSCWHSMSPTRDNFAKRTVYPIVL